MTQKLILPLEHKRLFCSLKSQKLQKRNYHLSTRSFLTYQFSTKIFLKLYFTA